MTRAALPDAPSAAMIYIVDDDAHLRASLVNLLESSGHEAVISFDSAEAFLRFERPDVNSCLILDLMLGEGSGLHLQAQLQQDAPPLPIIFMSGVGSIAVSVQAMKAGAETFLTKPLRQNELLDAVETALAKDRQRRASCSTLKQLRARHQTLTPRERQTMALAITGLLNKQIADRMGISNITVKIHRGHAMKKMGARTFADLVRMGEALGIGPAPF
ncbi:response regulator [Pseudomonas sp. SZMC_28357]|uniref:response regulator transcription factor n=1 Tax=Pseudomonas sp. SZMC_28357 TaxID=3074380 RepID=UPI00287273FE|nr:response regulator [Pseudomonas sp. SZMC_28357]MDR9751160.1 response regulator [Pseudomonas sp. SZMC_28357]